MQNKLAHYEIKDPLGSGTFATVYRAHDTKFKLDVALKILNPIWMSDTKAIERFRQEATTMRKLRHPNIVQIYDMDIADGQLYLAEFLVEGETLAERIARAPLTWQSALKILRPIASALDYAHQQGLVHRDLKPQNILISQTDEIFISDFGLVHAAEGSVSITASSGGLLGTAGYMAPEQWRDERVTSATDVYALTCIFIEMLTGKLFFHASNHAATMTKHLVDRPPLPADWASDVPAGLNRVLEKGLALDPAERIQSAGDLLARLEKLSAPKPTPKPAPKPQTAPITQPPITNRQSPRWLWGTLAIAAVVIIMLAVALSNRPDPDDGGLATTRAELTATQTAMAIVAIPPKTATTAPKPTDTPVPPAKTATATATKTNTPRPTATPTPFLTINTAAMNIRSGPGTNYDIVGKANQDDTFAVTARTAAGDWLRLRGSDERWVYANLVQINGTVPVVQSIPPTPPPTLTLTPTPPPTPTPTPTLPPTPIPTPASRN